MTRCSFFSLFAAAAAGAAWWRPKKTPSAAPLPLDYWDGWTLEANTKRRESLVYNVNWFAEEPQDLLPRIRIVSATDPDAPA